jgi:hypothetical protein
LDCASLLALWSAATGRRFEIADMSAQSKYRRDSQWLGWEIIPKCFNKSPFKANGSRRFIFQTPKRNDLTPKTFH